MNPWKISTFVLGLAVVGLLGLSTSTGGESLQGSFGSGSGAIVDVMKEVTSVHDELGYSSWTLEELSDRMDKEAAVLHDQLGYSSWTLEDVAAQVSRLCN